MIWGLPKGIVHHGDRVWVQTKFPKSKKTRIQRKWAKPGREGYGYWKLTYPMEPGKVIILDGGNTIVGRPSDIQRLRSRGLCL